MKPQVCCVMPVGPMADLLRLALNERLGFYSNDLIIDIFSSNNIPFGYDIYVCPWFQVQDLLDPSLGMRSHIIAYGSAKCLSLAIDAGAVDYMHEHWDIEELYFRVMRIVGKKAKDFSWGIVLANGIESVINGVAISMPRGEHQFFQLMVCNAGKILDHECILNALCIRNTQSRVLSVYASTLRLHIKGVVGVDAESILLSCYGRGYLLQA